MTKVRLVFALALLVAIGSSARAQLTRGFISGTLQDPSGAVLTDATVQITNVATNTTRDTTTNEAGFYRFVAVEPGTYSVEFTRPASTGRRLPPSPSDLPRKSS